MAEHKPDSKLVETPMEYLCGDPNVRKGPETLSEIYGLKGPEGVSANGGIEFNLIRTDILSGKGDQPSDAKQFKGNSEV